MSNAAETYRDFRARGGVVDLSDRVKLSFTGADRVRYLNGQVTSNVQKLAPGHTQPACVTTAKGRLCAEIMLTAAADSIFLDADASLQEVLPARFERYIISDDVTLHELPAETRLLHFLGEEPRWLHDDQSPHPSGARGLAPASPKGASGGEHQSAIPSLTPASRFGQPGWDWWTDHASVEHLWPRIVQRLVPVDETLAELIRIEAGIPRWGRELTEDTLPPEAGLDRTHIDYHKGCYIGQEVISRLKSVGHVNRQLSGFASATGTPLSPGASLFAPGNDARPVGVLTSVTYSFALEKPIALGYLKRGSPAGELLARPADPPGVAVTVCALPFVS